MLSLDLINSGAKILKRHNIKSHLLDAALLLSQILKKKREDLLISDNLKVQNKDVKIFKNLVKRRIKNEPISYILNKKDFWKYEFFVNKKTLIPRP